MALEVGVFKAIRESNGKSVSATALAKITGYDVLLISTISFH